MRPLANASLNNNDPMTIIEDEAFGHMNERLELGNIHLGGVQHGNGEYSEPVNPGLSASETRA